MGTYCRDHHPEQFRYLKISHLNIARYRYHTAFADCNYILFHIHLELKNRLFYLKNLAKNKMFKSIGLFAEVSVSYHNNSVLEMDNHIQNHFQNCNQQSIRSRLYLCE